MMPSQPSPRTMNSAPLKKRIKASCALAPEATTINATPSSEELKRDVASTLASLCKNTESLTASTLPSASPAMATSNTSRSTSTNNSNDGNVSDSDSSTYSTGSRSSPFPRAVHAPPVTSMMVDHTYTDYSVVSDEALMLLDDTNKDSDNEAKVEDLSEEEKKSRSRKLKKLKKIFGNLSQTRKNSGGVVQPFPVKLMEVLDRGDMEDRICWMPHGRSFAVLQPQVFVNEVLPRFFKQSKFMSFTRQLNLWGFRRITKGTDSGAYYHELFLRGRPRLCMLMRRQKIKGTGIKLTPNPDTEPNFYKISEDNPLPLVKKEKVRPLPPLQSGTAASRLAKSHARSAQIMHSHFAHVQRPSPIPQFPKQRRQAGGGEARRPFPYQNSPQMAEFSSQYGGGNANAGISSLVNKSPTPTSHRGGGGGGLYSLDQELLTSRNNRDVFNYSDSQQFASYQQLERAAEHQMRTENQRQMAAMMQHGRSAAGSQFSGMSEPQGHQRGAVTSAMDLHYQANNLLGQDSSGNSPQALDDLKHRLLAAARALDSPQPNSGMRRSNPGMSHSTSSVLGGMMHQQDIMRPSLHYPRNEMPRRNATTASGVNASTLMTALEQTQKVAAAAQEQSAILQRFAEEMNLTSQSGGGFR